MNDQASTLSSVKLGLVIAWPALWTGIPLKLVVVLLLLAMSLSPWEWPGLAFLLLLSVPIDIWALTLCARTVFLERLRREPPRAIGLTLWWRTTLFSGVYVPVAYLAGSQTVAAVQHLAGRLLDSIEALPISERIGIELSLWGSAATVVWLALALGWLYGLGRIIRAQLAAAHPVAEPYSALVRRWDLLRVPADQPLLLTIFMASGVVLVLWMWAFMPVTTPRPHEMYQKSPVKAEAPLRPVEAIPRIEQEITRAEAALQELEAKAHAESKGKQKGEGEKGKGKRSRTNLKATGKQKNQAASGAPAPAILVASSADGRHPAEEEL